MFKHALVVAMIVPNGPNPFCIATYTDSKNRFAHDIDPNPTVSCGWCVVFHRRARRDTMCPKSFIPLALRWRELRSMLKSPVPQLVLFFDMEWVPDAVGARRLYDLPGDTTELAAMQRLWESSSDYCAEKNPRPFLKYMLSRVVSIAFLSRKPVYVDGEKTVEFGLHSLPELPVDEMPDEAPLIDRFLYILGKRCPPLVGYNSAASDRKSTRLNSS